MSRNRSISTAAAMSIERTTSANSTVTCLYSAGVVVAIATGAPHSLQNFEFGGSSVPHDPHAKAAAVISRGQPTVVPRHYRVTAGETNVDPYRPGQPVQTDHGRMQTIQLNHTTRLRFYAEATAKRCHSPGTPLSL